MRKHRLTASFASSAVAAGAVIGTAVATGQPATAAPAQPQSEDQLVHDFMVANNLLKFEHAAYWHIVDGRMVFAKDPVATAAPVQHTFSAPAPQHQAVASSSNSGVSGGVWGKENGYR